MDIDTFHSEFHASLQLVTGICLHPYDRAMTASERMMTNVGTAQSGPQDTRYSLISAAGRLPAAA